VLDGPAAPLAMFGIKSDRLRSLQDRLPRNWHTQTPKSAEIAATQESAVIATDPNVAHSTRPGLAAKV
jgi:hypothetical protein